jgi:molecular chaperone IbpA
MVRPTAWQPNAVPHNKTRLLKEQNMPDLFDQIFRSTIGFDPLRQFVTTIDVSNYPPYNIEKTVDADVYALTMAVAGFSRDELDVFLEDGVLHVYGDKKAEDTNTEFLYRGLSFRNFKRTFQLGKHIEVTNVSLKDGLLNIVLQKNVPESARRKFDF